MTNKNSSMTVSQLRAKISRFILVSNSILFAVCLMFFVFKGLDEEELTTLIGMLAPITSVYLAAIIKFAVANPQGIPPGDNKTVNKLYVNITYWAIPTHFVVLLLAISLFATGNFINFNALKLTFLLIETFFGAYVGIILASLFKIDNNDTKKE